MNSDLVVDIARSYLDTPYKHQGRIRGVGVDCLGLVSGIASELGIFHYENVNYSHQPDSVMMSRELDKQLIKTFHNCLGCILFFCIRGKAQHLGISCGNSFVHAYQGTGFVVEQSFSRNWMNRLHCCYKYPGVVY